MIGRGFVIAAATLATVAASGAALAGPAGVGSSAARAARVRVVISPHGSDSAAGTANGSARQAARC